MTNSRYEYVKQFERENYLLQDTYIIVRVDGRGFHKFSTKYDFAKPNDLRALDLMNKAAHKLMETIPDIVLSYGDSDEYSFLLKKDCALFERRESKLVSTFASSFSAYYQFYWPQLFTTPLDIDRLPTFDARCVVYPNEQCVRHYFAWRQVDCHINNLYNTTFWNLVNGGMSTQEAENALIGTLASDKNEILFSRFGINYNNEPEIFRKGTVMIRGKIFAKPEKVPKSKRQIDRDSKQLRKMSITAEHTDLIGDAFWTKHS